MIRNEKKSVNDPGRPVAAGGFPGFKTENYGNHTFE